MIRSLYHFAVESRDFRASIFSLRSAFLCSWAANLISTPIMPPGRPFCLCFKKSISSWHLIFVGRRHGRYQINYPNPPYRRFRFGFAFRNPQIKILILITLILITFNEIRLFPIKMHFFNFSRSAGPLIFSDLQRIDMFIIFTSINRKIVTSRVHWAKNLCA